MRIHVYQLCRRLLCHPAKPLTGFVIPSKTKVLSKTRSFNTQVPSLSKDVYRFLTTSPDSRALSSQDNILRSHRPDIQIPTNVSFHEYMFGRCDLYADLPAAMEFLTGKSYTYSQVKEKAIKVASALHRLGYKKGNILLAFSPNQIDMCILMLACACLGVWYSAANPGCTADEFKRQVDHSGCVAIFTIPSLAQTVIAALNMGPSNKVKGLFVFGECPGFQPFQNLLDDDGKAFPDVDINPLEDVFTLPYSSGTTGLPKGVMLTHYNILANCLQMKEDPKVSVNDHVLGLLPLYHIFGMVVIQYCCLQNGGLLVTLPKFEPETFLRCIQDKKMDFLCLVPALITFLVKHPMVSSFDLTSMKRIFSGAAPLGDSLTREFLQRHSHGVTLVQGFGMTETSPVTNLDTDNKIGSVGAMIPNTFGKIVDPETNKTLGPNTLGEYCVKGPQVMKGYFNNLKATDDMITSDGWLHTGDMAYFTEDNHVFIKDRMKELIKYKGNQVSPAELEAVLIGHSDIIDVAVVGIPDDEAGELPKAFVVKRPGTNVSELDIVKFVKGKVARDKWLRGGVQFIEIIPRNLSGKVLRRVIKDMYVTGSSV